MNKYKKSSSIPIKKPILKKVIKLTPKCLFISEKKCNNKNCDTCLICRKTYCGNHIFDHTVNTHKDDINIEDWTKEFKKAEYENKLLKLQEKYSQYID